MSTKFFLIASLCVGICIGIFLYVQRSSITSPVSPVQTEQEMPQGSGSAPQVSSGIVSSTRDISQSAVTVGSGILYNITWTPRTLSGVYYQFGVGNPHETDKSVEDLIKINQQCLLQNTPPENCDASHLSQQAEYLAVINNDDGTFREFDRKPSRITPEIEYKVYAFISNPIILQSTQSCGAYFWKNGEAGTALYPNEDMGEVEAENWWNPYDIDINNLIFINPDTGRKELNIERIWTLKTQISLPQLTKNAPGNYTNIKLTSCLEQHHLLTYLRAHVDQSYHDLLLLWR